MGKKRTFQELDRQGLVVVLIDMQTRFVESLSDDERKRIVPNQITVLRQCQKEGIPVIVLEFVDYGATIDEISREVGPFEPIEKDESDGFTNGELERTLREFNAKTLFLMGINSDACVLATAQSAFARKFDVATSEDVIGSSLNPSKKDLRWYAKNATYVRMRPEDEKTFARRLVEMVLGNMRSLIRAK